MDTVLIQVNHQEHTASGDHYEYLEWYTRVYATPDYGITYLFHDRRVIGQHGPTNSVINWSRFSGVGYGTTLFHSRHCVER